MLDWVLVGDEHQQNIIDRRIFMPKQAPEPITAEPIEEGAITVDLTLSDSKLTHVEVDQATADAYGVLNDEYQKSVGNGEWEKNLDPKLRSINILFIDKKFDEAKTALTTAVADMIKEKPQYAAGEKKAAADEVAAEPATPAAPPVDAKQAEAEQKAKAEAEQRAAAEKAAKIAKEKAAAKKAAIEHYHHTEEGKLEMKAIRNGLHGVNASDGHITAKEAKIINAAIQDEGDKALGIKSEVHVKNGKITEITGAALIRIGLTHDNVDLENHTFGGNNSLPARQHNTIHTAK